jgi:hypothetical protein
MSASAIIWPSKYLPGTTDNYVSNEIITANLSSHDIWPLLSDISKWESYYWNVAQITPPAEGPTLVEKAEFSFSTFGFPPLPSRVVESTPPTPTTPGRLAWIAESTSGEASSHISVYHAWLVEDLEGGRVRILTQESQIGEAAKGLAGERPDRMLNGHQDWLVGLVKAAKEAKGSA